MKKTFMRFTGQQISKQSRQAPLIHDTKNFAPAIGQPYFRQRKKLFLNQIVFYHALFAFTQKNICSESLCEQLRVLLTRHGSRLLPVCRRCCPPQSGRPFIRERLPLLGDTGARSYWMKSAEQNNLWAMDQY